MKLFPDDVRDIMMDLEANQGFQQYLLESDIKNYPSYKRIERQQFLYTLQKIQEAGYINAELMYASDQVVRLVINYITWDGHQFLANVAPETVWQNTKDVISEIGGMSIPIISSVAGQIITASIKSKLGFS